MLQYGLLYLFLFIRLTIVSPFSITGESMYPILSEGDLILVNKTYTDYKRGDIIIFMPPGKTVLYMKRIIGLPGETILINSNKVTICKSNAKECTIIDEPYLETGTNTKAVCDKEEFKLTTGYFVLGDNRGASTDSRCCFGLSCYGETNYEVPSGTIIGKIFLKLSPNIERL